LKSLNFYITNCYYAKGDGELALVFVHGWACDKSHWDAQVPYFSETHAVVTVDLAGHGKSGSERTIWTIEGFGKDVQAVVEGLGLSHAVLVGHSMGGPVVLEAEQLMRNRIAAIIGVDTFTYDSTYPKLNKELIDQILAPLRANFTESVNGLVRSLFSVKMNPAFVEKVATTMSRLPPGVGLPALEALLEWDVMHALQRTRSPIRCINSQSFYEEKVGRRYAEYFDVVTMPGVGHFVMMEDPPAFNRLLEKAIKDLVGPRTRQ